MWSNTTYTPNGSKTESGLGFWEGLLIAGAITAFTGAMCTKAEAEQEKNAPYRNRRAALIRAKLRELAPQEPDFREEMAQFCLGLSVQESIEMCDFAIDAIKNNSESELIELEEIRTTLIDRWNRVNNFFFFDYGWVNKKCSFKDFATFAIKYWQKYEQPKLVQGFWQKMTLIAEEKLCLEGLL